MPSWKIHSYIGNQVNKTIKVNKKYFMIGNLLPDQDRYNIGNLKRNIPRTTTHFIKREDYLIGINLPDYDKMYNKYKDKFKNPVLMGYLVHLLTDYYFNNYIHKNLKRSFLIIQIKSYSCILIIPGRVLSKIHTD